MIILVANLGSTSFKFKVLDSDRNYESVANGFYERIGQPGGEYPTHDAVIDQIIKQMPQKPDAIGFKAVHGGPIRSAVRVTDQVISTMQAYADAAPAHNPVYIAAMKSFKEKLPDVPQVAAFETAFHSTQPASRTAYAIPHEWTETHGIRRFGFHGASNAYVSRRMAEILGRMPRRHINCHLGGSCSVTAMTDGKSIANSFGMTPQSGVFANNRVGDFEFFLLPKLLSLGMSVDQIMKKLGKESGLLGMSGVSTDMRDVEAAAMKGDSRAKLAVDAFVESVRHYIGAFMVALGGCDVLSFTGGIGENAVKIRAAICANLGFAALELDDERNVAKGTEAKISADYSGGQIWVIPTNEELIVARQTVETLSQRPAPPGSKKIG